MTEKVGGRVRISKGQCGERETLRTLVKSSALHKEQGDTWDSTKNTTHRFVIFLDDMFFPDTSDVNDIYQRDINSTVLYSTRWGHRQTGPPAGRGTQNPVSCSALSVFTEKGQNTD